MNTITQNNLAGLSTDRLLDMAHRSPSGLARPDMTMLSTELVERAERIAQRVAAKLAAKDTFDIGSLAGTVGDLARAADVVRNRIRHTA